jgi:hypothetical protein
MQMQAGMGTSASGTLLDRVAVSVREIRKVFLYTLSRAQDLYDYTLMEKQRIHVILILDC